jgi:hypothetical protein
MTRALRLLFALLISIIPEVSMARRGFGGRYYSSHGWNRGYWFHGAYGGRAGWWWIVGPTWYYYPVPAYPYPPYDAEIVYSVQVSGPPPPPAPPPPNASSPSPPAVAPTAPPSADAKTKAFSYYCEKSKNYYPIVSACAEGWIATPVQPPK